MPDVTTKAQVIEALKGLPEDATIEGAIERLCFMAIVEKGIAQADAGETVPHEEVKKRFGLEASGHGK